MTRAVRLYVFLVFVLTIASGAFVYMSGYTPDAEDWKAGATFGCLVALAYLLAYKKTGRSESGSIAFLPLLAAVFVSPTWSTVVTTASAMAFVEIISRRAPIKAIFNVSQAALAVAVSIAFYLSVGGQSLLHGNAVNIPAFVAVLFLFVVVNTIALNGVIAASESRNFLSLLRQRGPKTLVYDLYALPFVYVFAWVYAEYGFLGAAALVLPILGVRELYKNNWELQTANQELLELMVAAIEARDPYTSGHSRRVSKNSRLICESLGMREKAVERIATAALLHDVGKIHEVFGPILSKPGKLTDAEMAVMKTHPIKSEELVMMVSRLRDLAKPVRHHHENWDGSGYPDRLSGDEIPLASRIIMFADTIDAMTTDRPYRRALPSASVKAELKKYRGTQFDPTICDLVLASDLIERLVRADASFEPAPVELTSRTPSVQTA